MVSFYAKLRCAENQEPSIPIVAKLEGVWNTLDDADLLKALQGKRHRGCQGYPVAALWRSYLAGYFLNIPTVAGLIRALKNNPALCDACGLGQEAIPSEATYSRFVAKLTKHSVLVQRVIGREVERLCERIPDFGRTIAIDSSDIPAYSQSRKPSDHDARWGKKRDKHGHDKWWFGYKVHVIADAEQELPIYVRVTPANVSDSETFIPVLEHVKTQPAYVVADAGYDAAEHYRFVSDHLHAVPVIKLNPRGRRSDKPPHRSKAEEWVQMYRTHPGVERGSAEWDALYDKRTAIERVFSRMKEFRRLASVHHRGLPKVTLHCYVSTLTIMASAMSALNHGQLLRKVA